MRRVLRQPWRDDAAPRLGRPLLVLFQPIQYAAPSGAGRVGNADRGHSCGGCSLDTHLSVFKDEAVSGRDAEAGSGGEERVGRGLGARVVLRADKDGEAVEQMDSGERLDDGLAAAAGDDGERNAALLGIDVLEDFRYRLEVRELVVIEALFAFGDGVDRHVKAMHLVQCGDNLDGRLAAPGVEEIFVEVAAPLTERLLPGGVMERHGIDDGAVAVEKVGAECAGGNLKGHRAPKWMKSLVEACIFPR
jgi:hypothetical protein